MDDYLISQFIDNELVLDEKIDFVQKVHDNRDFAEEALSYLEQEKILQAELEPWQPTSIDIAENGFSWRGLLQSWRQPMAGFAAASVIAAFIALGVQGPLQHDTAKLTEAPGQYQESQGVKYRFVLYREAAKVEIIGSFTHWQKVPLIPAGAGAGAYWEVTLPVGRGEHKYSFVVDGTELLPDPTVAAREPDDFGTVNSILKVEV